MSLYTLLFDYLGGTYVGQVRASSPSFALTAWLDRLEVENVSGLTPSAKKKLTERSEQDHPVEVQTCENAWCWTTVLGEKLALVNIVKTAE